MKNIKIKYILFSMIACILVIASQKNIAIAASGTIKATGGGTVQVGDVFTITLKATSNDNLMGAQFGVTYDSSILEYIPSGGVSDGGGGGTISVIMEPITDIQIKFKALKPGNSSININNAIGVADTKFDMSASGTSVTVKAPVTHSKDNTLKTLQIAPGTLSPSFNPNTTSYSVTVPNSTQKVTVSANPNHSAAKVTSLSGTDNLKVGSNNVNVVVTAEDGSTRTYTIRVTREQGAAQPTTPPTQTEPTDATQVTQETEETQEATEEPTKPDLPPVKVDVNNKSLYINSDFEPSSMPESFSKETMDYDGREINVARSLTGDLILFYLSDEGQDQGEFYVYDKESDSFDQYIEVEGRGGRYIILTPKEDVSIPDNYKEGKVSIDGKEFTGWQLEGMESNEFYLVYAMNGSGNKGLYHYDTLEKTFQRYSEEMAKLQSGGILDPDKLQEDLDASNNEISKLNDKYKADMGLRIKIIIGLIALSIILFIITINLILRNKFLKDDLIENQEEEFDSIFVQPSENSAKKDLEETGDWSEEFAATKEPVVKEDTLEEKTNKIPTPPVEEAKKDIKKKEEKTRKENNLEANEVKSKEEDKTSQLENASLEEIFEFLNVEDIDSKDKDL